jgi:hypothetical protein
LPPYHIAPFEDVRIPAFLNKSNTLPAEKKSFRSYSMIIRTISLTIVALIMMGCAITNHEAYSQYYELQRLQIEQAQKPMLSQKFDERGKLIEQKIYMPRQPMKIEQPHQQVHPGWKVVNTLLKGATIVGGIWATGDAMEGVIGAATGATTITATQSAGGNAAIGTGGVGDFPVNGNIDYSQDIPELPTTE